MTSKETQGKTDFGFEQVSPLEKTRKVGEVFRSVAPKYDLMNDLMSLGVHRYWKRFTVGLANVRPGHQLLDLASGTGDLAVLMAKKLGETGQITLSDINPAMLALGRDKILDKGLANKAKFALANAESLPFESRTFDGVSIAFGLRNVTHKEQALKEMRRVLKPGGKLIILEFSKIVLPFLDSLYKTYAFQCIPKLGQWVTNDAPSYQYLVESIEKHPDQETLKKMMMDCGFERCDYFNLTGGIAAVHRGYVL